MRQSFTAHLFLILSLNLLVKPFYILGIEAEIQNRVGPEVFGSYFALIGFSFILNIIPDMGTSNWNTRHIAQNAHLLRKHFSKLFTLRIILSALYIIVICIFGFILHYSQAQMWMLGFLALNQVFLAGILFIRSNLTGLHMFKHDSIISVLDKTLLIALMAWLLWGYNTHDHYFKIEWLVWGQCITTLITFSVGFIFLLNKTGKIHLHLNKAFNLLIIKQSMPYALLIFFSMVAFRIDGLMLEKMASKEEAGIYAMGFRFFEAVNMISYLFAVLLLPIFSRMLKEKQAIGEMVNHTFKLMFCGIFILALATHVFSKPIIELFYDNNITSAESCFIILMYGAVMFSLQYVFGTLITASGKLKPLIRIAIIAAVVNIVLNSILIPQGGAIAAAKSCLITQSFILTAQVIVVLSQFKINKTRQTIAQTLPFIALCSVTAYFFKVYAINYFHLVYGLAFFCLACLLFAIITGMLNLKRFLALMRPKP